jgi:HPt (histidine-containing phosphotransfer) domain-containing protein
MGEEAHSDEGLTVRVDADIVDLADRFIENRRGVIERVRAAIAAEDWCFLQRTGHELKGTAGSYGFLRLSALGRELETAAAVGDGEAAAAAVADMIEYLRDVRVVTR